MSGQQIGTVVGGVVGAFFGQPQLGMAIGGLIGGAIAPDHINGPKIGDGQQQSATDGAPIAWVQGTAMVAGTIVQVSPRRQIRHKDNGKGGPVQVTYTAVQDFAIIICESSELRDSTMSSVLMVMQDGKLVYDVRPGSTMLADSYKWKANVDFLFGDDTQLPHPTLEAITGVGNTPAYRGSCIAVFKNFDVSTAGDPGYAFQYGDDFRYLLQVNDLPPGLNAEQYIEPYFPPAFDDSSWLVGPGPFGNFGSVGTILNPVALADSIWLRKQFAMPAMLDLAFEVVANDWCAIWLNGQLIHQEIGR